jgi:uncharacterized protein YggE
MNDQKETIRVTGKSSIKAAADQAAITFRFRKVISDYSEAAKTLAELSVELKDYVEKAGYSRGEMKNVDYSIVVHNVSFRDAQGYDRSKQDGYEVHLSEKIIVPIKGQSVAKILAISDQLSLKPSIDLGFEVKDEEKAKNEALSAAIKDGLSKAEIIATAAGVGLGADRLDRLFLCQHRNQQPNSV